MKISEGQGIAPFEDLTLDQQYLPRDETGRPLRSSSPAVKRPASDMGAQDREEHTKDVDMDKASGLSSSPVRESVEIDLADTMPKAKQQDRGARHRREVSVDMLSHTSDHRNLASNAASDDTASTMSEPTLPTPSAVSAFATSMRPTPTTASPVSVPSIDEQVVIVRHLIDRLLEDRQKGYIISRKWLNRVLSRSSAGITGEKFDKSATEGDIGPVDNSDLFLVLDGTTQFIDEAGEPFVPLRPGVTFGDDYQVVPQEAWDFIIKWYGMAQGSPTMTRYVHNTSTGDVENLQYEFVPPVFSILKVPANPDTVKNKESPPVRSMASRHTSFQAWLRKIKPLVDIDLKTKVRVWRVLGGLRSSDGSGILTPAASRSASPAPGANIVASAGDRMVLDVKTFAALRESDERELLEPKDAAGDEKYNGKGGLTLDIAGLCRDEVIVLEEQIGGPGGGEWPLDFVKSPASHLSVSKSGAAADRAKNKGALSSGRSSPAQGMITRGRQRKDGKPRGITGLSNLGNTCYMNSALQSIRAVEELTQYFLQEKWKKDLNPSNPLGNNGEVAKAYAQLLHQLYGDSAQATFHPRQFKSVIGKYGPNFSGYGQQDSQEFLLFLLDGLQEDLNRILKKPYIEKPDSTDEMVHNPTLLKQFADECWRIYKARNDSVITDLFAGMYKSTVTCPVCSKVSIIFDPFNNLTLQLPIENNWNKEIFFSPLHQRPVRIDVDIDKNSNMSELKQFIVKRMGGDPDKMVVAEVYKAKFYKLFDNNTTIAEANIQNADEIWAFELESIPTNFNPNKPEKYSIYSAYLSAADGELPDIESPGADSLLVPIFHRVARAGHGRTVQRSFFGIPSYIIVNRSDAKDYDGVLKKVLGNVAGMTTKNILDEEVLGSATSNTPEESDTVVMNDDDLSSDSNHVQAASVEGEDGFVDISMKEASGPRAQHVPSTRPTLHQVLRHGEYVPPILQNLFEIKAVKTNEAIPLGWNSIDENKDYQPILERVQRQPVSRRLAHSERGLAASSGRIGSSSSDEDGDDLPQLVNDPPDDDSDAALNGQGQRQSASGSESDVDELPSSTRILQDARGYNRRNRKPTKTYDRKGKKFVGKYPSAEASGGLVRPGEGLILDWNYNAYDALFEGTPDDVESMRGAATWKDADLYRDEALAAKRNQRQTRRRRGVTLDDCLNEFGKVETLSENNAWYCPSCKEHRRASKRFELWKAPDILVMHLKRFSSNRNFRDKLEIFVEYPVEGLDLNERVIDKEIGQSLTYDLIAVDNHYGGLGGGHYTAFAQNFFNKGWYEYNDSHVSSKHTSESVVTSAAYLLFYRRRSEHPLGGPVLEQIVEDANAPPADSSSQPNSRDSSPSGTGEGRRLDGSSHNGSSSAYNVVDQARPVGGGSGLEDTLQQHGRQLQGPGVSQGVASPRRTNGQYDELPGYSHELPVGEQSIRLEMDVDDEDEAVDISNTYGPHPLPWVDDPMWSFQHVPGGRPAPSQITAAPPASLDFHQDEEEDLFADADNDHGSTKAAGGDGSSTGALSEEDDRMKDLTDTEEPINDPLLRGSRESAPPPLTVGDDDEDQLPVVELRPPSEETRFD